MQWKTYAGNLINEPIQDAVEKIILSFKDKGQALRICIGTDSKVKGNTTDMATVILFLVIGNGGFMYVNKQRSFQKMSMKERMLAEVGASIETAWLLSEVIQRYSVDLEIHADINQDPKYKSNQAFHDAMGYTKGMGFKFLAKPDAFASSVCADRLCHNS